MQILIYYVSKKEVTIQKNDAKTWKFPCNRWLDKNEEDGLIERDLLPIDSNSIFLFKYLKFSYLWPFMGF